MIALFLGKVKSKETEKRRENAAFPAPKLQYFGENHGKALNRQCAEALF
jgi:hypothetical protein